MELIIYSVVSIVVASLFFSFLAWFFPKILKEFWQGFLNKRNTFPAGFKSFLIIFLLLFLSGGFIYWYKSSHGLLDPYLLSENELKLMDVEALSNIRRNIWLLAFAIFGGGLAIWARVVNQKQLENSAEINRNDRFAKAAEMLSNIEIGISSRGGLHILRDLILEAHKTEYIRCVDIISHWLVENEKINKSLFNVAITIIKLRESNKDLEYIIDEHKRKNFLDFWPNLQNVNLINKDLEGLNFSGADMQDANLKGVDFSFANLKGANLYGTSLRGVNMEFVDLQGADLLNTNLEGAKLEGANLEGADLTKAYMVGVKNLTKEQILSAKWLKIFTGAAPPKLPNNLMKDPDVQEWLDNSIVDKAKKNTGKKPKN